MKKRDVIGEPKLAATPNWAGVGYRRRCRSLLRRLDLLTAAEIDATLRPFYIIAGHIAGLKVDAIRQQQQKVMNHGEVLRGMRARPHDGG